MQQGKLYLYTFVGPLAPFFFDSDSIGRRAELRRLDIAALAVIVVCNAAVLLLLRWKRVQKRNALGWTVWNGDVPAAPENKVPAHKIILWAALAAGAALGVCYSWITGHWIILPAFLAVGCWTGLRGRKLLRE